MNHAGILQIFYTRSEMFHFPTPSVEEFNNSVTISLTCVYNIEASSAFCFSLCLQLLRFLANKNDPSSKKLQNFLLEIYYNYYQFFRCVL